MSEQDNEKRQADAVATLLLSADATLPGGMTDDHMRQALRLIEQYTIEDEEFICAGGEEPKPENLAIKLFRLFHSLPEAEESS